MQQTIGLYAFRAFGKDLPLDGRPYVTRPTMAGLRELFEKHMNGGGGDDGGVCSQKKGHLGELNVGQMMREALDEGWSVSKVGTRSMDLHCKRDSFVAGIEVKTCRSRVPVAAGRNKVHRDAAVNGFHCNAVVSTAPIAGVDLGGDQRRVVGDTLFLVRSPPLRVEDLSVVATFFEERYSRHCSESSSADAEAAQLRAAREAGVHMALTSNLDYINVASRAHSEQLRLYLALVAKHRRDGDDTALDGIADRLTEPLHYPVKLNAGTFGAIASQYTDLASVCAASANPALKKAATGKRRRL